MWYIGECLAEPEPCHSRAGIDYSRKAPSMGEGLGRGEAAQFLSDRLVDAVDICQDFVIPKPQNAISLVLQEPTSLGLPGRRAVVLAAVDFPRSTGPRGTQNRQFSDRSPFGGGTCIPLFDASAASARAAFPLRSCSGVKSGLGHVRRRPDASSCLDLSCGKRHPLPTLPYRGGGLQGEADAAPPVERAM